MFTVSVNVLIPLNTLVSESDTAMFSIRVLTTPLRVTTELLLVTLSAMVRVPVNTR